MGGFKLTEIEIKELVEGHGGQYLGEETIKHQRILTIKCNEGGHIWRVALNNFKDGDWCLQCRKDKSKITRQKILYLLNKKGYILQTDGEFGLKTRFKVYCPIHNYSWESCYWNFRYLRSGGTCKLCASKALDFISLVKLIESKNGTLIKRVKQDSTKRTLVVKCNIHSHTFKTSVFNIWRGIWCAKCDDDHRRITHKQIKDLVEEKGGTLLDETCIGALSYFNVLCNAENCGRKWETTWSRIGSGCWCPRCANFDKYTFEEVDVIVRESGGTLLDTVIKNAHQKVNIKCDCGNQFEIEICKLVVGGWCQVCREGYRKQLELYNILKELYPRCILFYNFRGFDWLRDKYKLEIDIWIPELGLAIEYDGEQHFRPVKFASTMTDEQALIAFNLTQAHDAIKDTLIPLHPDDIKHFVRLSYTDAITKESVAAILKSKGVLI